MKNFIRDESGATIIEYSLLAALIAVGAIVAMDQTGASVRSLFEAVAGRLDAVTQNATLPAAAPVTPGA